TRRGGPWEGIWGRPRPLSYRGRAGDLRQLRERGARFLKLGRRPLLFDGAMRGEDDDVVGDGREAELMADNDRRARGLQLVAKPLDDLAQPRRIDAGHRLI